MDLNGPYLKSNLECRQSGPDYLSPFSVPTGEAPQIPLVTEKNGYVDVPISSKKYLYDTVRYHTDEIDMTEAKKEDQSPTLAGTYNSSPKYKYDSKVPEKIPMLKTNQDRHDVGESDDDQQNDCYTDFSSSNLYHNSRQSFPTFESINDNKKSNGDYVNAQTSNAPIANHQYYSTIITYDEEM